MLAGFRSVIGNTSQREQANSPKHRDNSPKHRDNSPKHWDNSPKHQINKPAQDTFDNSNSAWPNTFNASTSWQSDNIIHNFAQENTYINLETQLEKIERLELQLGVANSRIYSLQTQLQQAQEESDALRKELYAGTICFYFLNIKIKKINYSIMTFNQLGFICLFTSIGGFEEKTRYHMRALSDLLLRVANPQPIAVPSPPTAVLSTPTAVPSTPTATPINSSTHQLINPSTAGIRTHILLLTPELESGKLDRSATTLLIIINILLSILLLSLMQLLHLLNCLRYRLQITGFELASRHRARSVV